MTRPLVGPTSSTALSSTWKTSKTTPHTEAAHRIDYRNRLIFKSIPMSPSQLPSSNFFICQQSLWPSSHFLWNAETGDCRWPRLLDHFHHRSQPSASSLGALNMRHLLSPKPLPRIYRIPSLLGDPRPNSEKAPPVSDQPVSAPRI